MKYISAFLTIALPLSSISAGELDAKPELSKDLEMLKPFLGQWEINATWSTGNKLWAKNIYRTGLNGKFVEASTFAKDGDGEVYERYRTVFCWDKTKDKLVSHGFTHDGSASVVEMQTKTTEDGQPILTSQWKPGDGPVTIKQRIELKSKNEYRWQVWSQQDGSEEETELMDGTWKRIAPEKTPTTP